MGSGLEYPWGGHAALRGLGENMKNGNNLVGDETLYHQYLCGDDTGLDALMKRYGDPLTLYIDGYLHDIHEAEELMIDVFADLFTKKPKIRDGGFKAYLYKAARHMALRRKSRRRPDGRAEPRTACLYGRYEPGLSRGALSHLF